MVSAMRRFVLRESVAWLAALTLVQGSVLAQPTQPRAPDSNQSRPLVLSKGDVDRLKAAAGAKAARALVVATVERVERIPTSPGSPSVNILFYLFSDGGPVVARAAPSDAARLESRFATGTLAGKTIKMIASNIRVNTPGVASFVRGPSVELAINVGARAGGDAAFVILGSDSPEAGTSSVRVDVPVPVGPAACQGPQFRSSVCIDEERRAAESGDAAAMGRLGWRYLERTAGMFRRTAGRDDSGTGVSQNNAEAVRWLRAGAVAGDPRSMANLGFMYAEGVGGVIRDDAEAVRWFQRAADAGDRRGMTELGLMHSAGRGGLKQDYVSAARWFRTAAVDELLSNNGDYQAMLNLGLLHLAGNGVPQDDAEAVRWLRRAANGDGSFAGLENTALFSLGVLYATGGAGLAKDIVSARDAWRDRGRWDDPLGAGRLFELGNGTAEAVYEARDRYFKSTDREVNASATRWTGGQIVAGVIGIAVIAAALADLAGVKFGPASQGSDRPTRSPLCNTWLTGNELAAANMFGPLNC